MQPLSPSPVIMSIVSFLQIGPLKVAFFVHYLQKCTICRRSEQTCLGMRKILQDSVRILFCYLTYFPLFHPSFAQKDNDPLNSRAKQIQQNPWPISWPGVYLFVGPAGVEPATFGLKVRSSTN